MDRMDEIEFQVSDWITIEEVVAQQEASPGATQVAADVHKIAEPGARWRGWLGLHGAKPTARRAAQST